MLPYFKYTEEVQTFCMMLGIKLDFIGTPEYVCMNSLKYSSKPRIVIFALPLDPDHLVPESKVLSYMSYLLNGYSLANAFHAVMAVGE